MVSHHEVIRLLDDLGPMVLVTAILGRDEEVRLEDFVDVDLTVIDADRVTLFCHDPLDE